MREGDFGRILKCEDAESTATDGTRDCDLAKNTTRRSGAAHRVATVLGRRAQSGEVEVIQGQPYRIAFFDRDN
ncbi:hypothetical protein C8039_17460 [Halogeometricum sp. wsp3]|nr:hypothetical protein C8039_17460 [Halogeometricum sp. wsp3]